MAAPGMLVIFFAFRNEYISSSLLPGLVYTELAWLYILPLLT